MQTNKHDFRTLRVLLIFVLPAILLMTSASAATIVPRHADREAVEEFLVKLGKQFPNESQRLIEFGAEGHAFTRNDAFEFEQEHSLWIADVNNDELKEYFWTIEADGSGHYDSFDVYRMIADGTLSELDWPELPGGLQMPSNLDSPPIIKEQNVTYLMLLDIWSENKKGEVVAAGANCNAATDAYYLVTVRMKCRWDKDGVTIVSKEKQKTKFLTD